MGTGALIADALLSAEFTVLAVDRRSPMSSSTPASTALIQSELDMPFPELQRKIGKVRRCTMLRHIQGIADAEDELFKPIH